MSTNTLALATTSDVLLADILDDSERQLLSALLSQSAAIDLVIPLDINLDELWKALTVCVKTMKRLRESEARLKPLVGRILMVIEDHPDLYKDKGYRTFDDFMTRCIPEQLGIARGEAYHAKRIASRFSTSLSPDLAARLGFQKLARIARVTGDDDPKRDQWIDYATSHTLREVQVAVMQKSGLEETDFQYKPLLLDKLTRTQYDRITGFLSDARMQAYCGTDEWGAILCRCIPSRRRRRGLHEQ